MTQRSLFWDGASVGDADVYAPYDLGDAAAISPTTDVFLRAVFNGTGNRGVLKNWANELAVAGVATPVTVATGGALVYGLPYENTTVPVSVAVPSPTNATRYDRIVVRRDWAAQTARVTRIAGVEGGAIPALTQSPAPDGSGLYDIPLAYLEVDTLGNITVTDEREWILMSTAPLDGVMQTAHLTNESADWTARQTRSKIHYAGGGDWQPMPNGSRFYYSATQSYQTTGVSTWGSAAASEEGWQCAGAATRLGFVDHLRTPPDWVPGTDIDAYIWWLDDVGGVAFSTSWYTMYQCWQVGGTTTYGGATTTSSSGTNLLRTVKRQQGHTIDADDIADGSLIEYAVFWYNLAGAEAALFLGVEFVYTGYL